jgi:hypothetical protein
MERFTVRGYYASNSKRCFTLNLPSAKRYFPLVVKNGEMETHPELLISTAVKRKKYETTKHVTPWAMVEKKIEKLPKTFQQLLLSHPFPLNQGPLIIALDTNTEEKKSVAEVMKARTVFSHSDTQPCARWVPEVRGKNAWTCEEGKFSYKVTNCQFRIQGPASTVNMGLVFTCQLSGCIIHCPCQICTDTRTDCCKAFRCYELCSKCNTQCTTHQITVPYMFSAATDLFTLVTEKMDQYRFAHGYAGIPSNCADCSNDVLEHQMFHLVYHKLCRFCRYEMRAVEQRRVLSLEDYKGAEAIVNWRDGKTCSVCLLESKDKYAREKHEAIVHRHESQKFKCDLCPKSYSSQSSLIYHSGKHQEALEKFTCDLCGKQFASDGTMNRHNQIIHSGQFSEMLSCDCCDKKFSLLATLKRHQREQHFNRKLNSDFYEGSSTPARLECDQCDMKFKRSSDLKRHVSSAHSGTTFNCSKCELKFSRKDNLNRHIKSKH